MVFATGLVKRGLRLGSGTGIARDTPEAREQARVQVVGVLFATRTAILAMAVCLKSLVTGCWLGTQARNAAITSPAGQSAGLGRVKFTATTARPAGRPPVPRQFPAAGRPGAQQRRGGGRPVHVRDYNMPSRWKRSNVSRHFESSRNVTVFTYPLSPSA